ncbi:uncharacterized protein LOC119081078 [Bradysia coprophila]|uniref:uncharacterized protein LOC119081078 n=1 Tax=Bradysia coprophila TaxID=38358 RepID=UPI00187D998A|nr:uncharacterized protein LOC119081078 [Bradysia coprophila]
MPRSISSSFNRSTSQQLASSLDSLLASSEEQFAYQCPPNSVAEEDSGLSSSDPSLKSCDSFRRRSYQCPTYYRNSMTSSDQMSLKEDTPSSTDTSIPLQQLNSISYSLGSTESSLRSFGGSEYECPSNSVTGSDQMNIPEDVQSSTNSSIRSHRKPSSRHYRFSQSKIVGIIRLLLSKHYKYINKCARMVDTTIDLQTIPLSALRLKSRNYLATYLDAINILPSSDGCSRDWRGIFQRSGLGNQYMSFLSDKPNPTIELIKILEGELKGITFGDFRFMLGVIDRWDVVDDTYELFVDDALEYLKKQEKFNRSQQQYVDTSMVKEVNPNCLTIDDVILAEKGLPLQQYDAFILFADKDIDFATEMIEKCEAFGLKLCVKERDFLAGLTFEHDAIRHLLTERCDRLVVILSPDFVCSPLNEYIANLAQSLGIAQRKRKIIPCLYKQCELPEIFRHIHLLNYQRSKPFYNFWDKLKMSLQTTPEERIANQCPQITITDADQKPVTKDVQDTIALPVRPYKRNTSQQQLSKEFESLPTPISAPPITSDSNKKFWPPSPKLRSATSMVNLTDLDMTEMNNNEQRSKKPKWYNKLSHTLKLTPQTLKLSGSESNLSKEKTKTKKNIWRRIKMASHS